MNNYTTKHAIGTFETRENAEAALHKLRDEGFNMDKVSIITRHDESDRDFAGAEVKSSGEQAKGGAKAGATAGAATGGVLGLIGGLGVLAIPGVGPVAELGVVLANTLLGGGIGAVGGGLIGALIGWGVPEDQAKYYNDRVSEGHYLLLLEGTTQEVNMAESILQRHQIRNWNLYDAPTGHPVTGRVV
ncbi:hypothetical protein cce_2511 [Crocosphaera subtropica ATCC 51142]|uniref:General stress protein 17M-like domain-containing protein n=1 Tax=Crocosphaera subtropica (strain ATCC 51142 / BH68) TaxID=43989 RepID=B1WS73_CROS5|nr:general stress protein [Crocosphaera subtropica]ACB51859.1 hypothetical protein cce_2511 [Crocosphaera subtropica ATCC 51142]